MEVRWRYRDIPNPSLQEQPISVRDVRTTQFGERRCHRRAPERRTIYWRILLERELQLSYQYDYVECWQSFGYAAVHLCILQHHGVLSAEHIPDKHANH